MLVQKNLLFEESAVRETLKELKQLIHYNWHNLRYTNKGRYCIVYGEPNIAILLKSEPFFTFGYLFREYGQKGVGDTINVRHLKEFIQNDVKLIYTKFRDGKLYVIPLQEFLRNSFVWTQKEGTKCRSISIHLYQRVNS